MNKNIEILLNAKLNEVNGFKSNAVSCQIKQNDKLDLGIVFSERICDVFAAYTKNKYKAAPIIVCKEKLKNNKAQAIIVNSGNANACTGEEGISDAKLMCKLTSDALSIDEDNVVVSSTGVIGARLPIEKIKNGVALLKTKIFEENDNNFCKGIMTTDTKMKIASVRVKTDNKYYTIFGCAKGSGMIHPNMATMLSYVFTDANIKKNLLKKAFFSCVEKSFNSITVDGDTSTNDTAMIFANGTAKNKKIIDNEGKDYAVFCEALTYITTELAKKIVEDGEGATKLIEINVLNAKSELDAKKIGMSIAQSSLVKTAFFGEDANWGRIICALGYSEADFDVEKVKLSFEDLVLFENGKNLNFDEEKAKKILSQKEIKIYLDLNYGDKSRTIRTCDLSYEYVRINGSYRS